jgi:uncharacterized membrane protein
MKRFSIVFILVLAFCGLANSAYLMQHEASGTPLLCSIQNLSGCNIVAASQYSRVLGVPVAEYGVIFYGIIFILAALELAIFQRLVRRILQAASLIGAIVSLCLTLVQVFLIGAFCIYCLASTIIALLICISAIFIEPMRDRTGHNSFSQHSAPELPKEDFRMPPTA